MKNLYLFEINDVLTNQAKLPYSTGLIWSYCDTIEDIKQNYQLKNIFWWRESTENILAKMENPSVVGFSCFVWNWNNNVELAREIKKRWPSCIIVFGGWQAPMSDRCGGFFAQYPYVDVLVHGEGEITFSNILLENIKDNPDWNSVKGCSIPKKMVGEDFVHHHVQYGLKVTATNEDLDLEDLDTVTNEPQARISDLTSMPSPYLNGLFDSLIKDCPYDLEATIETTRGCPYACTYCEIGTKYYQKIKSNKLEKVYAEIDWLSKNKVVFVYNADSNFGMLKDHLPITEYLVKKKKETGYPEKHRCDWSKNQAHKVIELAKIFYDAEMDKGITIALQSMNPETLKAIKRKNVDGGKLQEFLNMYSQEELPSYVELILGLPEETVDSFVNGICDVISMGQHNYIGIYPLTALPNTPFGEKEYIEKYGLNIIDTYPAFSHVDISDDNEFEREHMVVGTNKLSKDDYIECTMWRWLFMFGHYLGPLQYVSRFINNHLGITFKEFYSKFMQTIKNNPDSFFGKEYSLTRESLEKVLQCTHPWGRVLSDIRDKFAWDFEEATVMRIAQNKEIALKEIKKFIVENFELHNDVIDDLLKYQNFGTVDPNRNYPLQESFSYNIHDVIFNNENLNSKNCNYEFNGKSYDGNFFEWGKETLWWGRRVGANKIKPKEVIS